MVDKLTDEHVREIRYVFNLFDSEKNDGNITKVEMVAFLKKLGIGLSEAEVNELFDMFDSSGNGNIDYPEFLSLMTKQFDKPPEDENEDQYLRDAFDLFDTDEDGLNDGVETGTGLYVSTSDTGTFARNADSDNDGILDGDEVKEPFSDPNNPADPPPPPFNQQLIGHWTFDDGEELIDQMGNFPDLVLEGDAEIADGSLNVNGSGTTASGWAWTSGEYTGPDITEKTLVSWFTLELSLIHI